MSLRVSIDWGKTGFHLTPSPVLTPGEHIVPGAPSGIWITPSTGLVPSGVLVPGYRYLSDVTSLVRREGGLSAEYGRDQTTALAPSVAGRGGLVLDNIDRRFSPRNITSPLYGYMKPARPVLISRTISGFSDIYVDDFGDIECSIFRGHTDDTPINPDLDNKSVTLSLVDSLADFRGQTINTSVYSGIRTGEAINLILDACDWSADLRDIDRGATHIPWWWEDNTDALTALEKLVRSEGPPALLHMGADGEVVFRDRHHRLLRAASLTSTQTWGDVDSAPDVIMNLPFRYDEAWSNIINTGTADVEVRVAYEMQDVWTSDSTISLAVGEQKLITASASDPFYDAQTPVAGTDWVVVGGTVTAILFRVSGASATIKLTAIGGAAVISGLKLRARPISVVEPVQVSVRDQASINDYGSRAFPGDLPWCSPGDAEAVLETAVALRAQPLPIINTRFLVGDDVVKASLLNQDLGNRVTITESETAIDGDFYIETIGHELTGEHDHAINFGLEATAMQVEPIFRLDTAGAGADQGFLGSFYIDPGNLLICDSNEAGHRVDEGATAA